MKSSIVIALVVIVVILFFIFFSKEEFQLPSKRLRTMGVGMRPEISIRQLIGESTGLPADIVDMIRFADFESMFLNTLEQRILEKRDLQERLNDFDYYTTGALKTLMDEYVKEIIRSNPDAVLKQMIATVPASFNNSRPAIEQLYMLSFLKVSVGQWIDPGYEFVDAMTHNQLDSVIRRATEIVNNRENLIDNLGLRVTMLANTFLRQAVKQNPEMSLKIAKTNLSNAIAQMKRLPAMYGNLLSYCEGALTLLNRVDPDDEVELNSVGVKISDEIHRMELALRGATHRLHD